MPGRALNLARASSRAAGRPSCLVPQNQHAPPCSRARLRGRVMGRTNEVLDCTGPLPHPCRLQTELRPSHLQNFLQLPHVPRDSTIITRNACKDGLFCDPRRVRHAPLQKILQSGLAWGGRVCDPRSRVVSGRSLAMPGETPGHCYVRGQCLVCHVMVQLQASSSSPIRTRRARGRAECWLLRERRCVPQEGTPWSTTQYLMRGRPLWRCSRTGCLVAIRRNHHQVLGRSQRLTLRDVAEAERSPASQKEREGRPLTTQ